MLYFCASLSIAAMHAGEPPTSRLGGYPTGSERNILNVPLQLQRGARSADGVTERAIAFAHHNRITILRTADF